MGDSRAFGGEMLDFLQFHCRQLSRAVVAVLYITAASFGVTLVCALVGLIDAVEFSNFGVTVHGVPVVLAYVFGGTLVVFLLTALVCALVRFLNRRSKNT
jgi:hypothetical protein